MTLLQFFRFCEASDDYNEKPADLDKEDDDDDDAGTSSKEARLAAWEKARLAKHNKARQDAEAASEILYQSGDYPKRAKNKNCVSAARAPQLFFVASSSDVCSAAGAVAVEEKQP